MAKRVNGFQKVAGFLKKIVTRKNIADATKYFSELVVIIGLPIAIFQYNSVSKKEKEDREYEVYNSLDQGFIDWEKLCLKYPNLDIFDIVDEKPRVLNESEQKEELILFTILFSLFERSYVLYGDESNEMKKAQWEGWNEYILDYCKRKNFRRAWKISGSTFESQFQHYMEENMKKFND